MRKSNRVLFKPKVYGFNPWADQMPAIKSIMEEAGQDSEAPVLRMLVDEALRARRRKGTGKESPEPSPPAQELEQTLQTVQALLLKMIEQGQIAFRVQSLSLELLQETLVEARAARMSSWEHLAVPALREQGKTGSEIADFLESQTAASKDFAYRLAEEIKKELLATDNEPPIIDDEGEDRQGRLMYDETHTGQDEGANAH
jgi:hypothetical protein